MYVFRARYVCPGSLTELDGNLGDMALEIEQALGLALCACVGVILMERVHLAGYLTTAGPVFRLQLEVRSPDRGTRIQRAAQGEMQHVIERIVLQLLRELFGPVVTEAVELGYEACDAAWGEAVPSSRRTRARSQTSCH